MKQSDDGRPTAIDLFSGCGGLTLGLKLAGFNVLGAVEIESAAVETYKANHSEVIVWKTDIRQLSVTEVMKKLNLKRGDLDLLSGCPPCQGFSSIRTRNKKSIDDRRNELVFEFFKFAKGLMPKSIMMENVPGLIDDWRLNELCNQLNKLGYKCIPKVFDASDFGVPQRRKRMILTAGLGKEIDLPVTHFSRRTVRDAIESMPPAGASGDPLHDFPENRSKEVMDIIKIIPKDGGGRRQLAKKYQLACHKKCPGGYKDIYGRMKWDDVSPTITGGCVNPSKGRFLHPVENRAITLREAAVLQTFPRSYKFSLKGGKQQIAAQIGNALPPEFIKRHAGVMRQSLLNWE